MSSLTDKEKVDSSQETTLPLSVSSQNSNTNTPQEVEESAGDGTVASQHIITGVRLYLCCTALCVTMFLMALDQTITATILTTVGEAFNDFGKVGWLTSAFLLPMAVLALNWSKLSLVIGRKYSILLAIVLFEIGSLVCALAQSMNTLLGGRVIAGIGAGGIQVLTLVIMTEIVPVRKRPLAQGVLAAAFGIASITGPLVGGVLTSKVTWRWCFYINLPFGALAFASIYFFFNPPFPTGSMLEKLKNLDYVGTFLVTTSLVLVLLAPTFGSVDGKWNDPVVISFFVVGGVLLAAFCAWNFHFSKDPLIPWVVIKVPSVVLACVTGLFFYGAFITIVTFTTLYFQVVQGDDALQSGIHILPCIIPIIVVALVSGAMITATGYIKGFIIVGTVLGAVGAGVQSLLDINSSSHEKIGLITIAAFGGGFLFQSITISAQVKAPKTEGGVLIATAFMALNRNVGGVIGNTMGQTIFNVVITNKIKTDPSIPTDVLAKLETIISNPAFVRTLPAGDLREQLLSHFVQGYRAVMYFCAAMYVVAFVLSLFTTNYRVPKTPEADLESEVDQIKGDGESSTGGHDATENLQEKV